VDPRPRGPKAWWPWLRARPAVLTGLVVATVAAIVVVLVWFQPQTLLFDTVVEEEFPVAAVPDEGADGSVEPGTDVVVEPDAVEDDATEGEDRPVGEVDGADDVDEPDAPTGPVALGSGGFSSRGRYSVEGSATTYALEDGSRILRLEDFTSTNGPDLLVYLTSADAADSDGELGADFIDLGLLTGNVGNQNYVIPDDVDLERYDTVVIWCRRFTVGFGAADLSPA
jgi:hypothetical protein